VRVSQGDRSDSSNASDFAEPSELAEPSDMAEPMLGPAAHSMDTDWFAVDALGHVGVFESGEGGAVPGAHFEQWHSQSSQDELLELLLREPARSGVRFDDLGLFEPDPREGDPWDRYEVFTSPEQLRDTNGSAIFELADARAAADPRLVIGASDYDRTHRLPCERVVLTSNFVTERLAHLWWELGVLRVRTPCYDVEPNRLGLFRFSCTDYSAGPYVRGELPRVALRVESLSSSLRHRLSAVSFGAIDFRRDAFVQPFEHLPSHAWSQEWLGTDGEMHSVE